MRNTNIKMVATSAALLGGLLLAAPSGRAFAAYPLATDDAGTVKRDSCELEASYDDYRDEADLASRAGGLSFKHGVTDRMDIGLSLPYRFRPETEGRVGAASLALKFSLVPDRLAFSVSNELGEKEYFLNGILSGEFGALKAHLNAGYLSSGDETTAGSASFGIAAEYPLSRYAAVAELRSEEGGSGEALLGLRYALREGLFVSAGGARRLEAARYRFTCGFHMEF